jgi:hypothetical protein
MIIRGIYLRQVRTMRGLTRAECAQLLGIGAKTLQTWENTQVPPDKVMLVRRRLMDVESELADFSDLQLITELMRRLDRANGAQALADDLSDAPTTVSMDQVEDSDRAGTA